MEGVVSLAPVIRTFACLPAAYAIGLGFDPMLSIFSSAILSFSRRQPLSLRPLACGLTTALIVASGVGCWRDRAAAPAAAATGQANSTATLPRFPLRGEIVGLIPARRVLLVHHEEIPNYMPAMTMEFTIGDASFSAFKEGQKLAATMVDLKDGNFLLEGIRLLDPVKDSIVAAAARQLKEDTFVLGQSAYRDVGEAAPRFTLYDQEGAVVAFDRLRGKRVILNFIFTRCPIATMCPAATMRMTALQRLARERQLADVQFISISLDPAYDTPPVLKTYATAYGIDLGNFSFLTGPEDAVRSLLVQFGVIAEPSVNIWKHSLSTVLIDRDGRIAHRIDGSTWEPEDFLHRL